MVFGSVVRDEARTDSDVDLLVEFDCPVGLFTFVRLKRYLEEILESSVDLGILTLLNPIYENTFSGRQFVPSRDWQNRIRDVLEAIAEIQEFTSGMTFEQFQTDCCLGICDNRESCSGFICSVLRAST